MVSEVADMPALRQFAWSYDDDDEIFDEDWAGHGKAGKGNGELRHHLQHGLDERPGGMITHSPSSVLK